MFFSVSQADPPGMSSAIPAYFAPAIGLHAVRILLSFTL